MPTCGRYSYRSVRCQFPWKGRPRTLELCCRISANRFSHPWRWSNTACCGARHGSCSACLCPELTFRCWRGCRTHGRNWQRRRCQPFRWDFRSCRKRNGSRNRLWRNDEQCELGGGLHSLDRETRTSEQPTDDYVPNARDSCDREGRWNQHSLVHFGQRMPSCSRPWREPPTSILHLQLSHVTIGLIGSWRTGTFARWRSLKVIEAIFATCLPFDNIPARLCWHSGIPSLNTRNFTFHLTEPRWNLSKEKSHQ